MDAITEEPFRPAALDPRRTVHVAIDIQDYYLGRLRPKRRKYYPRAINGFVEQLRKLHAKTIWVAFGQEYKKYKPAAKLRGGRRLLELWPSAAKLATNPSREEIRIALGLRAVDVRPDEAIYSKCKPDAFMKTEWQHGYNKLPGDLRRDHTDTVVLTGLMASHCIPETALGAARLGLNVIIISDLLADGNPNREHKRGVNKASASGVIDFYLKREPPENDPGGMRSRIRFMNAENFIAALERGAVLFAQPQTAPQLRAA